MAKIVMYTKSWCPYCDRAKSLLTAKGQTWQEIDVEAQPEKRDEMVRRAQRTTVPQIFIGDVHVGGFDDLAALERAGKLDALLGSVAKPAERTAERVKLLIIGSGPAGYTAAIYAGRADLQPVMLAGLQFGGQLMLTTEVENYPGFPEGVTGPEMMERFQKQAERFGTRILNEDATQIDFSKRPFRVESESHAFLADAVIVATGASAKWIGLPSEQSFMNRGVSACATCDGALFRGKPIAVVGGGDTALEEALFLTRYAAPKVTVIHRRGELRASKIMRDRALKNEKIEFVWNSAVEEVLGGDYVTGLRVKNLETGALSELKTEALFVAIGHKPSTDLFRGVLEMDDVGYLKVEKGTSRTNIEGVFACGDAMDPTYRQAVTAAGTGCMAAIDAERWLAEHGGD
jgi:thioredoxin reductase (NADPH)